MAARKQSRRKRLSDNQPEKSADFLFDVGSREEYIEGFGLFGEGEAVDGRSLEDILTSIDCESLEDLFTGGSDHDDSFVEDDYLQRPLSEDPCCGETAPRIESSQLIRRCGCDTSLHDFFGSSGFFVTTPTEFDERIASSRPPRDLTQVIRGAP